MKKTLCLLLSLALLAGITVIPASAASAEPQTIYFAYPSDGKWGDPSTITIDEETQLADVYFYCYEIYGNTSEFNSPAWQTKSARCTYEGEKDGCLFFSTDLSRFGHIDDNADYGIIFSTTNGLGYQTAALTMTSACIGDTVYVIDGQKKTAETLLSEDYARWESNTPPCGVLAELNYLNEVTDGVFPVYMPRAQHLSSALGQFLLNPATNPFFSDAEKNRENCEKLSDETVTVTPLDVYNQYISDNASALESGTAVDITLAGKTIPCISFENEDGESERIPAPAYIREVLGLENETEIGDVNGDGIVNIVDATEVQKMVAGIGEWTYEQKQIADVNQDGKITIVDATSIQKKIAKIN